MCGTRRFLGADVTARARALDAVTLGDRTGEVCADRCRAGRRGRTRVATLPGAF